MPQANTVSSALLCKWTAPAEPTRAPGCVSSILGSTSSCLSQNGRRAVVKASWDVQPRLGQYGCGTGIKVFGDRRCIFSQDGLRLQICPLSVKRWKGNWAVDGSSPLSPPQLELTCREERTTDERDECFYRSNSHRNSSRRQDPLSSSCEERESENRRSERSCSGPNMSFLLRPSLCESALWQPRDSPSQPRQQKSSNDMPNKTKQLPFICHIKQQCYIISCFFIRGNTIMYHTTCNNVKIPLKHWKHTINIHQNLIINIHESSRFFYLLSAISTYFSNCSYALYVRCYVYRYKVTWRIAKYDVPYTHPEQWADFFFFLGKKKITRGVIGGSTETRTRDLSYPTP